MNRILHHAAQLLTAWSILALTARVFPASFAGEIVEPPLQQTKVLDDFESYNSAEALLSAYNYVNDSKGTITTASTEVLDIRGVGKTKMLKLQFQFAGGQAPFGGVRSQVVAPFAFPRSTLVKLNAWIDSSFASVLDSGSSFLISFFDNKGVEYKLEGRLSSDSLSTWTGHLWSAGREMHAIPPPANFDLGNVVQWQIAVQGREGTAASVPSDLTVYVDNLEVFESNPLMSVRREGADFVISWSGWAADYTLQSRTDPGSGSWQSHVSQGTSARFASDAMARYFRLKSP